LQVKIRSFASLKRTNIWTRNVTSRSLRGLNHRCFSHLQGHSLSYVVLVPLDAGERSFPNTEKKEKKKEEKKEYKDFKEYKDLKE